MLNLQSWAVEQQLNPNVDQVKTVGKLAPCRQGCLATTKEVITNTAHHRSMKQLRASALQMREEQLGDCVAAETTENLIHTVDGNTTQQLSHDWGMGHLWLSKLLLNSSHVIQLIHADEMGAWLGITKPIGSIPIFTMGIGFVIGINAAGMSPGGRITIQHAFNKPGDSYHQQCNKMLGNLAPKNQQTKNAKRNILDTMMDSRVTPSQVLATSMRGRSCKLGTTTSMGLSGCSKKSCIGAKRRSSKVWRYSNAGICMEHRCTRSKKKQTVVEK